MSKTININSVRLETALRKKFKTDRSKTISRALGFKDNALNEALKRGTVSNKMAAALDKLGIDRRDYEEIALSEALGSKKDTSTSETLGRDTAQSGAKNDTPTQLSIDDLESMRRDELKRFIKEEFKAAIIELFDVSRFEVDSLGRVTITLSPEALKDLKIEEVKL